MVAYGRMVMVGFALAATIGCVPCPVPCGNCEVCIPFSGCAPLPSCCISDVDCDDNDLCSRDRCVNKSCRNDPTACPPGQECNPVTGGCEGIALCNTSPEGTPCSDDRFCTMGDACQDGVCASGTASRCPDDGLFCNGTESCDEASDQCIRSGNPCGDDGLFCNGAESCDETLNRCVPSGSPCSGNQCCDEVADSCSEDPCCPDCSIIDSRGVALPGPFACEMRLSAFRRASETHPCEGVLLLYASSERRFEICASPSNGEIITPGDLPDDLYYCPNVGFTGQDEFTFRAVVGDNRSDCVTVSIDVISESMGEPESIEYYQKVQRSIVLGDVDTFEFDACSGDAVTIFLDNQSGSNFGMTTSLRLVGPDGQTIRFCDFPGTGSDCEIGDAVTLGTCTFTAPVELSDEGRYRIEADAAGSGTGAYDMWLILQDNRVDIQYGTPQASSIDGAGDQDGFLFQGVSGQIVTVFLDNQSGSNFGMTTSLRLYGPDGNLLECCNFPGTGSDCEFSSVTLPETGTYTVIVDAAGSGTGAYELAVTCQNCGG